MDLNKLIEKSQIGSGGWLLLTHDCQVWYHTCMDMLNGLTCQLAIKIKGEKAYEN